MILIAGNETATVQQISYSSDEQLEVDWLTRSNFFLLRILLYFVIAVLVLLLQ